MLIKKNNYSFLFKDIKYFLIKSIRFKYLIVFMFILCFLSSLIFSSMYLGAKIYQQGKMGSINDKLHNALVSKLNFIPNYFKGYFSNVEQFNIDIKFVDLEKLKYYRDQSLSIGKISTENKKMSVPATLTYDNQIYEIKISLTGLTVMHIADPEKWSFRIKAKDGKSIKRMREFNLLYPRARGYLSDWVGHKLQQSLGLIGLRMDFVNVTLNGKNFGLYCLEENYDKNLIENNNFREGIIFKWSDPIKIYNKKKQSKNPNFEEKAIFLQQRIKAYEINDINIEDIFDMAKMAKFLAINDLINGGYHGIDLSNTRFYLNPVTNLIEPIGREWAMTVYKNKQLQSNREGLCIDYLANHHFYSNFFSNPKFIKLYLNQLSSISNTQFLDNFFNDISDEMHSLKYKIYKEDPFYEYPKEFIYKNQDYIREKIYPKKKIAAYLNNLNSEKIEIFIKKLTNLPLNINSININDSLILEPNQKINIFKHNLNNSLNEFIFSFHSTKNIKKNDRFRISYNIAGIDTTYTDEIFPWKYEERNLSFLNTTNEISDLNLINFLEVDSLKKTILIKSGEHIINNNLFISDFSLIANYGCTIDLVNNSSIITSGPIYFNGTKEEKIKITSSDSTGNGIFVFNAKNRSEIKNVHFENLSNPNTKGWELTGAVTFYESDVLIDSCIFFKNYSGDDYLNIIRSNFIIDNTIFDTTVADAIDADFCMDGSITNSSFSNCGNDAIDISSTNLEISNVLMDNIKDKGLSSGENSRMDVNNIKITNSEIAICSKDMSNITIDNAILEKNQIVFTAYQKKSEFGPGNIIASNIKMQNNKIPHLIENLSSLLIDEQFVENYSKPVKDILYGVEYGKSSK